MEIQAHLEDLYGLRVSPDLISRVTDAVLDEVREWQHRALDRMYPIVIFDALRVKIRDADSRMVKIEPAVATGSRLLARGGLYRPRRHPGGGTGGSGPLDCR
jgi:transposase-like protein